MSSTEWTIIDTETTGIAAPIYTLEIAAQRMKGLAPIGKPFQVFINHEVDVPREAQAVHGYSRHFLQKNGRSPRLAHQSFAEYVGGTPLAAYNLPYDYDKVLVPEWGRLGLQTGIPRGFCVMRLTRKLLNPSPTGDYKLQSLRAHFGLPEREAHSALGDVLTVLDLLGSALLPHLHRLGLGDATAIARYLDGSGYPDHLPFGKHKGRHWMEALSDREMLGWLQWLARQDDGNNTNMAKWYLAQVKKQQDISVKSMSSEVDHNKLTIKYSTSIDNLEGSKINSKNSSNLSPSCSSPQKIDQAVRGHLEPEMTEERFKNIMNGTAKNLTVKEIRLRHYAINFEREGTTPTLSMLRERGLI